MKTISNVFLTHRQMTEAEAVYRILSSMTLDKSNIACQWVSLVTKEERLSRWKKVIEEAIEAVWTVEEHNCLAGYWYEQPDMWSSYLRRPEDIENMFFAQLAKICRIV